MRKFARLPRHFFFGCGGSDVLAAGTMVLDEDRVSLRGGGGGLGGDAGAASGGGGSGTLFCSR